MTMVVSEAKLAANRRNALKSTGPKTPEGKAASRRNSLTHGLCASVCVPDDPDAIINRSFEFFTALKPQDHFQTWLVNHVTLASFQVDRAGRIERRIREKIALQAELIWDDDRRLEVERVGARLSKDPRGTVELLRRSPHGCDWLMEMWAMLAHAAEKHGGKWTDPQALMAFDLLGTPQAFRQGNRPGTVVDLDGREVGNGDAPVVVARRMLAELKEQRELVADLDDVERALTVAELADASSKELRNIRRYESMHYNRIRWAVSQIQASSKGKPCAATGLMPRWAQPLERPKPTKDEELAANHPPESFAPPFDLEPDEYPSPGQKADIPKILTMRRQKQIARADARRVNKRKKIEELLA